MKLDDAVKRRIQSAQEPLAPARRLATVGQRARLVENLRAARQEIAPDIPRLHFKKWLHDFWRWTVIPWARRR